MSANSPKTGPHGASHDDLIAGALGEFERHVQRLARCSTVDSAVTILEDENPLRETLEGYRFVGEINRGGQAVVYRATQLSTQRDVAIKVVRAPLEPNAASASRFVREVRILGQLKHPNIVSILDSGTARGWHYYIMDFVPGWALDEYLKTHPLSLRERAALFAKIAAALNVAHLRGITHRDVKPGNIRVDPAGEPHLLDFGLAKVGEFDELASGVARTLSGAFVGSLPWASPEQVEGRADELDIRTDVYSIGVMFYAAITGHPPYDVYGPLADAMNNIREVDPPAARTVNRAVDVELSAIASRCLRKRPEDRYQSAGDLARDLERYLRNEAIEAKRDNSWYLIRKAIQRHRGRAAVAGLLLLTAIYSIGLLYFLYAKENRLRSETEAALGVARRQTNIAAAANNFLNDDLLAAPRPDKEGRAVTVLDVLESASARLHERFGQEPEIKATIHRTLGNSYYELGNYEKAVAEFDAALALIRPLPEDETTSELIQGILSDLGKTYDQTGRFTDTLRISNEALAYFRKRYGEDHKSTITSYGNVGLTLLRLGKPEEAEPMLRRAYAGAARNFGVTNEETQYWGTSLGGVLRILEKYGEAEHYLREAVETANKLWGENHASTQSAIGSLAELYRRLNRGDEAIRLYEGVLQNRRRQLGESHASTLTTLNNLAMAFGSVNRLPEAAALLEEGLRVGLPEHGDARPIVVSLRSNLAAVYNRMERHADAEPLHRAALDNARLFLPPVHPSLALYSQRLGRCLLDLGELDEARLLLLDAHAIAADADGPGSVAARDCAVALAEIMSRLGATDDADYWRCIGESAH